MMILSIQTNVMDWNKIESAKQFLQTIKDNGITYKKLDAVLFGNHAKKAIALIRKDGQRAFKILSKHDEFYMVKVALSQFTIL